MDILEDIQEIFGGVLLLALFCLLMPFAYLGRVLEWIGEKMQHGIAATSGWLERHLL